MLRVHSSTFRILDSPSTVPSSPIKRELKPEEVKNLQQDTQQATLIQEFVSKKNLDQKNSTKQNKAVIAQHLADLRKRGVLKDVSSELGFYTKQRVSEVDDASVHHTYIKYIHTYMYAYIHAYKDTYTHAYSKSSPHMCIRTHTYTLQAYVSMNIHVDGYVNVHICTPRKGMRM